jgi:hypothetical protein
LTRRLCVYRSSLGEPVRRPLRRCAGCACPLRVRGQRPRPGGGGRRRSTARRDCRSRVVPVWRRARLRRARGRDARAPGATLRCALLQGEVFGEPRRACAVRAPPARTRAGHDEILDTLLQVRASGAHAGGTPAHPAQPSGARFCVGRFLGSPGAPPARTRAGRPRTRRNPQVRAFAWGGFWGAPARLRRACGRDARAPGATLRCALLQGEVFGEPRRACTVRAPPARTRAGRSRTRCNPQVRAPLQGQAGWQAPACHLPFQASGRPPSLFSLCGSRGSEDEGQTRTGMPQTAH